MYIQAVSLHWPISRLVLICKACSPIFNYKQSLDFTSLIPRPETVSGLGTRLRFYLNCSHLNKIVTP